VPIWVAGERINRLAAGLRDATRPRAFARSDRPSTNALRAGEAVTCAAQGSHARTARPQWVTPSNVACVTQMAERHRLRHTDIAGIPPPYGVEQLSGIAGQP
jgi:hypothetical protein